LEEGFKNAKIFAKTWAKTKIFDKAIPGTKNLRENFRESKNFCEMKFREIFDKREQIFAYFRFSRK
jgi:hypothetical protein